MLLASSLVVVALASCSHNDEGSVAAEEPVTVAVSAPARDLAARDRASDRGIHHVDDTTIDDGAADPATDHPAPADHHRHAHHHGATQRGGRRHVARTARGRHSRDGEATKAVQDRLLQLGFWHSGADGEYGLTTSQAVMAFQKYIGLEATGKVDDQTAAFMSNVTDREDARHGRHR